MMYWKSAKNGGLLYLWGQKDQLRAYHFNGDHLDETPFAIRPERNQGHPGAMLSLSANGGTNGILWASIMASGDAWHESRPGILHAYDADDIHRELWNSLEDPARDDCANYSKMAPPTIANGKVYLASFGNKNEGTGQFCVYGLLPNGVPPSPVQSVRADAARDEVTLSWKPGGAAQTYRVKVANGDSDVFETIASGLTTPRFIDRDVRRGATYRYLVTAVSSNGESAPGNFVTAEIPRGAATSVMH